MVDNYHSAPPRPTTALCALLRRYCTNLDSWHDCNGGHYTQGLIDCCNVLINEGVQHD